MPLRRRYLLTIGITTALLCSTAPALAAGGNYVFAGGTPFQQQQVVKALQASSFNWSLVPAQITISIGHGSATEAVPGQIWLNSDLLNSGRFSWGIVQHEYAHQVDFFLLNDRDRSELQQLLGGGDWCYERPTLTHSQHACERFASTLAWAYWQSPQNCLKPVDSTSESAGMPPAAFRALMTSLLGESA
jgi:hypothetical protein